MMSPTYNIDGIIDYTKVDPSGDHFTAKSS